MNNPFWLMNYIRSDADIVMLLFSHQRETEEQMEQDSLIEKRAQRILNSRSEMPFDAKHISKYRRVDMKRKLEKYAGPIRRAVLGTLFSRGGTQKHGHSGINFLMYNFPYRMEEDGFYV